MRLQSAFDAPFLRLISVGPTRFDAITGVPVSYTANTSTAKEHTHTAKSSLKKALLPLRFAAEKIFSKNCA